MPTKKKVFVGKAEPEVTSKRWADRPEDGAETVVVHHEEITTTLEFVPRCPSTCTQERSYERGSFDTYRCQGETGHAPGTGGESHPHYHWRGMMGIQWGELDSDQVAGPPADA